MYTLSRKKTKTVDRHNGLLWACSINKYVSFWRRIDGDEFSFYNIGLEAADAGNERGGVGGGLPAIYVTFI